LAATASPAYAVKQVKVGAGRGRTCLLAEMSVFIIGTDGVSSANLLEVCYFFCIRPVDWYTEHTNRPWLKFQSDLRWKILLLYGWKNVQRKRYISLGAYKKIHL
jgi:hypothetical protein